MACFSGNGEIREVKVEVRPCGMPGKYIHQRGIVAMDGLSFFGSPTLQNEITLLLCCAQTRLGKHTTEKINSLVQKEIDWGSVINTAMIHRVMPLLFRSLTLVCPDQVPEDCLDTLRGHYLQNTGSNLARTTRLLELLALFNDHQITAIPFKGPVLAESAYGDLSLRQFSDLDILIDRAHVADAYQLLLLQGYQPEVRLDAAQIKKFIRTEYSLALFRRDRLMTVELHWEITGRYTCYSFDLDHFGGRFNTLTLSGKQIRQFPPEDMLVYLCIHGSKDGWVFLDSICCVNELIRSHRHLDWARVNHLVTKIHCRRMVALGFFLSHRLLGTNLPDHILEKITSDSMIKKLARPIITSLFIWPKNLGTPTNANFSMFHLAIRDRFADQLRHLTGLAFLPSKRDWIAFSLPARYSFLRYPLRPMRLAWAFGTTLIAKFFSRRLKLTTGHLK